MVTFIESTTEKPTEMEEDAEFEPSCEYCGAKLANGQLVCHVCGNKVD